ncbi:hypothetical protein G6717_05465 [Polynucleobacter paneuropaeus]|nr:hypothetical protein [Polynucleobacter paneuropaeus]
MTKPQVLEIKRGKDQSKEEALAEFKSKSEYLSTAVIESFGVGIGDDFNFPSTIKTLEKTIQQIKSGDLSKIEEMYISQAMALEVMFTSLARRAKAQEKLLQYETHMRFALKAQNQCRATLQALVQLKQPSNTTFVKQANIAQGHQQVNNLAEKNITPQNELLKGNYAELDTGTTTTPTGIDTTLEALGKINRR